MTAMAVNVDTAMIPVPPARPSNPSVKFTALAVPAMMRKMSTYHAQDSGSSRLITGR